MSRLSRYMPTLFGRPINLLAYNSTTWAEWTKVYNTTANASGLTITSDGSNTTWNTLPVSAKNSTKYGVLLDVVSNTLSNAGLAFPVYLVLVATEIVGIGVSGIVKYVFTSRASITTNLFGLKPYAATTTGTQIKLKDIRMFELPAGSTIEADFTNLTADQLNAKYPF